MVVRKFTQNILPNQQLVCSQMQFILKDNLSAKEENQKRRCVLVISTYCLHLSHIHGIDLEGISRKRRSLGTSGSLGRRMRMKDEHLLAPTTC